MAVWILMIHVARHSFASTVALGNDVPMESVKTMLGHTDIKTTQIYAHVVNQKLSRDMDKMAKIINNRNPEENALEIKARVNKDESEEKDSVKIENNDKANMQVLVTDETFLFSKKGKLKEISERDFFVSVVERGFKILYTSPDIKFATNGVEVIIGSKFFGEILGGYYSLDNQTGVFDDFHYGIIKADALESIKHQVQTCNRVASL